MSEQTQKQENAEIRRGKSKKSRGVHAKEINIDRSALLDKALKTVERAKAWALKEQQPDSHWVAELESNTTITSEYVFLYQALGLSLESRKEKIIRYFLNHQKEDGSWGIAFNYAGDVSTTVETYLALRILGLETDHPVMQKAGSYILSQGGIAKVRIFTRINLACFGLFPWAAIPVIPPEFIFIPSQAPINIYRLSSWARSTMVPLFIISHHKPTFVLPNGKSATNDWLDHLWIDPTQKEIPYCESWYESFMKDGVGYRSLFTAADQALKVLEKIRSQGQVLKTLLGAVALNYPKLEPLAKFSLRQKAIERCEEWVLEHQEASGDWAGIFPPMYNGVMALYLNGHDLDSAPVKKGIEAIERFSMDDAEGFRVQACESPVWDTVLTMIGLIDCGYNPKAENLMAARKWVENRQLRVNYGDWKVYNPNGVSGGWVFEYENSWYPDVDDTAAAVIALLKQCPDSGDSEVVRLAVEWIVSMQNSDGGWAAFDKENDKVYMNQIPFSDMDSLCDPSSPDVAGRVLEALGILNDPKYAAVCARGIEYLRKTQEQEGSWFGRWGVNYVYGTSNVLCALVRVGVSAQDPMVQKAIKWLRSVQNEDGGWGEKLESYADRSLMGVGSSTASQTAWGLMALLAYLPAQDPAILRGVKWLVDHETQDEQGNVGFWQEREFTGTGFPNHFYLRYHYYRHFFPMMALGRFVSQQIS